MDLFTTSGLVARIRVDTVKKLINAYRQFKQLIFVCVSIKKTALLFLHYYLFSPY